MWAITGVVAVGIFIVLLELPVLHKGKQYQEIAVFSILLIAGLSIYVMQKLHIHLPNPFDWIARIYESLGLVYK